MKCWIMKHTFLGCASIVSLNESWKGIPIRIPLSDRENPVKEFFEGQSEIAAKVPFGTLSLQDTNLNHFCNPAKKEISNIL